VEDGLHQSTVQSRTRIDGRNDHARRIHKGTESCVAACRGIELRAAVRIRMDAKYRLSLTPANNGRFECARRRFDRGSPTRDLRPTPQSQQPAALPEVSTSEVLSAFCF
jgi:hypothetical protein